MKKYKEIKTNLTNVSNKTKISANKSKNQIKFYLLFAGINFKFYFRVI